MAYEMLADPDKIRRYTIKIYPTEEQKLFLNRQMELFRKVYNWALNEEIESKNAGKGFISEGSMNKRLLEYRKENEWLQELPLNTGREAVRRMIHAYKRFFSKKARFPKFKSRKRSQQSFTVRNDWFAFYFRDEYVKISGLPRKEKILCKNHHIPKDTRYYSPTIIYDGYDYFLSVAAEVDREYLKDHEKTDESIGIDLGIVKTAQLSNGIVYNLPDLHVLEKRRRRLKSRLDKAVYRRTVKSRRATSKPEDDSVEYTKNELKLKEKFFRTCRRMTNIRHSFVHNMTTEIVNMYPKRIVIEDLNVQGMLKDPIVAKKHKYVGSQFYSIRQQLEYKSKERGIELIVAKRTFPSSQICSNCGNRYKIKYGRMYKCKVCGLEIDRDLNAAINLSRYNG